MWRSFSFPLLLVLLTPATAQCHYKSPEQLVRERTIKKTVPAADVALNALFDGYEGLLESPIIRHLWFREGLWLRGPGGKGIASGASESTAAEDGQDRLWRDDLFRNLSSELGNLVISGLPKVLQSLQPDWHLDLDRFLELGWYYELDSLQTSNNNSLTMVKRHIQVAASKIHDIIYTPGHDYRDKPQMAISALVESLRSRCDQMLRWLEEDERSQYPPFSLLSSNDPDHEQQLSPLEKKTRLAKRLLATIYDSSEPFPLMAHDDALYDWMMLRRPRRLRWRPFGDRDIDFGGFDSIGIDVRILRDSVRTSLIEPFGSIADIWTHELAIPLRAILVGYHASAAQQNYVRPRSWFWWEQKEPQQLGPEVVKLERTVSHLDRLVSTLVALKARAETLLTDLAEIEQHRQSVGEDLAVLALLNFKTEEVHFRDTAPYRHRRRRTSTGTFSSTEDEDEVDEYFFLQPVAHEFPTPRALADTLRDGMRRLDNHYARLVWWEDVLEKRDRCESICAYAEDVERGTQIPTDQATGFQEGKRECQECRRWMDELDRRFMKYKL